MVRRHRNVSVLHSFGAARIDTLPVRRNSIGRLWLNHFGVLGYGTDLHRRFVCRCVLADVGLPRSTNEYRARLGEVGEGL